MKKKQKKQKKCKENGMVNSVAEPPLFWAAPAPDGQGPGADYGSGSDLLGSAPVQKEAAPAPYTTIFQFKLSKSY